MSSLNLTLEAWADIVIRQWRDKINHLNIGHTGALFQSLAFHIIQNSGGNPEKIDFMFKIYGRFVDMGVGKEFYIGNPGDVGYNRDGSLPRRKPKKWYSPVMYGEIKALRDLLAKKYGMWSTGMLVEKINQAEKERNRKSGIPAKDNPNSPANRPLSDIDIYWMKKNGLL